MSKEKNQDPQQEQSVHVDGMYKDWFLDYASYVILERAVPSIYDGLKPVQRRILHAMKEIDDGRFHKVANIIGQTMQYHPHGDAAIGDALVNMGQKDLLIDTQGNWGDVRTGDSAAAPRYIEARLTKFALEVAFNKQTTHWQLSYDGRKNEPINLPMKFPLVLAQGAEGIAVGLSTKILPHNFIELCEGSIKVLQGKKTKLLPDFPTGGIMDASEYNRGKRGGRVKVRAIIENPDKKTLLIKQIPYGTTTGSLIDSILKANDKGKLKVKRVVDNTAKDVEILIELPTGVSPDVTMDALFAFTNCEMSISPNATVIIDDKPHFMTVDDILEFSTIHTRELLRMELEIKKGELEEKWHFSSLEKIFIENRIYRDIEEEETWEGVITAIDKGLDPFKKLLKREVTEADIIRLTEIKIKRISKFDSFKADEEIKKLEEALEEVNHHLAHLTEFAIDYFKNLIEKYGKGKERKTEIRSLETIEAKQVVAANKKLYVDFKEGFIGTGLKRDDSAEFVCECSDIDDIIVFRKDGVMMVSKVEDKKFMGKDILYANVWTKGDERTIYHMIYLDAKSKRNYIKRFAVTGVTRDKEYQLGSDANGSKVIYFKAHPNSESEVVTVHLSQGARARNKVFDFDFGELAIKGRGSKGNVLTKYSIRKVEQKELGESTLGGVDIWIDKTVGRLNKDERGDYLGEFDTGDVILVINKDGSYELTDFELTNHYDMAQIELIEQFDPEQPVTAVYYDGKSKQYYVKRFLIETSQTGKKYEFITEHRGSKLALVSTYGKPTVTFKILKGKKKEKEDITEDLSEFIDIKGWKALGNRLSQFPISGKIKWVDFEDERNGDQEEDEQVDDKPKKAEQKKPAPKPESNSDESAAKEKSVENKTEAKEEKLPEKETTETEEDSSAEVGDVIDFDVKKNTKKKIKKNKGDDNQPSLF
jgi:topoisomerase-4 subunit A